MVHTERQARMDELRDTAQSLRGSFSTIEDMTKGFIRAAITKGLFEPGQRLQQDVLAELLDVSRMPVRAALRQLESENLISFHPHRGATVRELSADEIAEIYELRILLECEIIDVALSRLTDDDLAELNSLKLTHEGTEHDVLLEAKRRSEFYTLLCEIAGRPWTRQLLMFLHTALGPYRLLLRDTEGDRAHLELVEFLRAGDAESAKQWLRKHLGERSLALQRLLNSKNADQVTA
jgi:DNA-binding GntR family transcriptional regulator